MFAGDEEHFVAIDTDIFQKINRLKHRSDFFRDHEQISGLTLTTEPTGLVANRSIL